jgi:PKD repeat protein
MKTTRIQTTLLATAIALALSPMEVTARPDSVKHYGKQARFSLNDLPTSKVKTKLRTLSAYKRQKAMNWLHSFSFTQKDLKHLIIDNEGGVLYGDSFDMTELTEAATEGSELPQSIAPADTFKLHSKPGASNVIFLDFDGHSFSSTAWGAGTINARPFDTDGNSASFSTTELTAVSEIWHRIAEDYAPFDVDVTTEQPANFGPTTGRILITHNKDVSGSDMPYASAGGVAYVNVWGRSNFASYYSPALVYYNNLASYAPYIAEAASHEMGHNLGLAHDGTSTQGYYGGHGSGFVSWGPIMGVGYYTNVTQWSKGEYTDASSSQDDISVISNKLTTRADDHGNDIFTPTELLVDAQGAINVTSPESDPFNQFPENKGIIESRNDIDFFAFDAGTGPLQITVTPAWDSFYRSSRRGANLDVQATLYNWDGQIIASSDPLDETDAQINASITSGQYLLAVTGVGNSISPYSDYGSLGQYFISGSVTPFTTISDTTPPTPNPMGWTVAPFAQSRSTITMQATTATDDSGSVQYNFSCISGTGCNDSGWQSSSQYTASGLIGGTSYSFQVSARDAYGNVTTPSTIAAASTYANNAPNSSNGTSTTPEDSSVSINLASLASDADGDPLTFSIASNPTNGTVTNLANGSVTYTPSANFNGTDNFEFTADDGFGGITSSSIAITVTAVNDAPVASAFAPANNNTLEVSFSSSDSFDPDSGDTLTYAWDFGDGSSSTASNPTHTYATAGNYTATLTVTDNSGLSDSSTIVTTVTDPNNAMPTTPSNLNATVNKVVTGRRKNRIVSGSINLDWNSSDFTNHYEIWSCQVIITGKGKSKTESCNYNLIATSTTTSYSSSLTNSQVKFKVRAANSNGVSSFSNEIKVSP